MKGSRAHNFMKVAIILIVAILLFPIILFLVRDHMYQTDQKAAPVTDLSTYQKWSTSGWAFDEPFAIFPEADLPEHAEKSEYLFKRVRAMLPLLYDDDAVLLLTCNYSDSVFHSECERLQQLCGNKKSGYGQYPAYVYAVRGSYYQYALIDDETCTIYYIGFQNRAFAEKYIDALLLPMQ